jgi:CheY-like chemotaxis protein
MQKQILIVDHAAERREQLKNLLSEKDFQVREAASCEEALEMLNRQPIPVVLTETELPTKSGFHLLKMVKERSPDAEVILLTHNASSYNLLQALRHGAYDFIVRPIDTGEILHNALERAFNHLRLREQNQDLLKQLEEQNRSLQRALTMLKTLNESIERLGSFTSIEELFNELLSTAMRELQADRGFIALFDRTADRLALKVSKGIPTESCRRYTVGIPAGLTMAIARRGKPLLIPGEMPEKLVAKASPGELGALFAAPGLLAAPLRRQERNIGLVILSGRRKAGAFDEHELQFLIQLANHTVLALEKVGIIHQLRRGKLVPAA